jgi:hypothetical protein
VVRSRVVQTKARRGVGWHRMCPDARGRATKTAARSDARSARVALPVELPTQDLVGVRGLRPFSRDRRPILRRSSLERRVALPHPRTGALEGIGAKRRVRRARRGEETRPEAGMRCWLGRLEGLAGQAPSSCTQT